MRTATTLALAAGAALLLPACREKAPANQIRLSGQVEVDTVKVVPLIGGKILQLSLEEGSRVEQGQVVATIDCTELELQLKQAEAAVKGASARLQLIEKGARKEDIRWMKQVLKQAKIAKEKTEKDLQTLSPLLSGGAIPQKQYDDLQTTQELASAKLAEAQQQYVKMIKGAQPEEIDAALSGVEQAEAVVDVLKQKLTYCSVESPTTGIVMYKLAEPGEVAGPGLSLGIIGKLSKVKVKGYVSEKDLGFVKLGAPARIYIDSQPGRPVKGTITWLASEAEFTPKNIQLQEERVKTVYQIEVSVDNPEGKLKAGMPADIVIQK